MQVCTRYSRYIINIYHGYVRSLYQVFLQDSDNQQSSLGSCPILYISLYQSKTKTGWEKTRKKSHKGDRDILPTIKSCFSLLLCQTAFLYYNNDGKSNLSQFKKQKWKLGHFYNHLRHFFFLKREVLPRAIACLLLSHFLKKGPYFCCHSFACNNMSLAVALSHSGMILTVPIFYQSMPLDIILSLVAWSFLLTLMNDDADFFLTKMTGDSRLDSWPSKDVLSNCMPIFPTHEVFAPVRHRMLMTRHVNVDTDRLPSKCFAQTHPLSFHFLFLRSTFP